MKRTNIIGCGGGGGGGGGGRRVTKGRKWRRRERRRLADITYSEQNVIITPERYRYLLRKPPPHNHDSVLTFSPRIVILRNVLDLDAHRLPESVTV